MNINVLENEDADLHYETSEGQEDKRQKKESD
jgi:hypothetical protein